jgi:predicted transcriptional regulator
MILDVTLKNIAFLGVFSSDTRVQIIEMLNMKPMNIKDMAGELGISSAIVTKHIQKLEDAGIVRCESMTGKRGMQKVCHLHLEQVTLQLRVKTPSTRHTVLSIPVGQYSSFNINPTCGLASRERLIGIMDDPRYFADPEHIKAAMLWFGSGWVEYRIPNYLLSNQQAKSLAISLEMCSEAPGYREEWPSDIFFEMNGTGIGKWTCPGDFGKTKGSYTPEWWNLGTEFGLLKTLLVTREGSFIDGVRISDKTIDELSIQYGNEILFRIAAPENAPNPGGLTLLGKGFGNYDQDIQVVIES